jgi:GTP-binding protein
MTAGVRQVSSDDSEAEAIEAGRLLFARPWRFVMGTPDLASLPEATAMEIAFAGRSNVGKSSLINAVTGQKALARTSNTPGRTQELNIFTADQGPVIVDMPGYGYAKVSKEVVRKWTRLVFAYLRGRANLRRVYLLIDARHGIKDNDAETLGLLDKAAVSYQIVLTKADKLKSSELAAITEKTRAALAKRPAAYPEIIVTSAETGLGIDRLRAAIATLAAS